MRARAALVAVVLVGGARGAAAGDAAAAPAPEASAPRAMVAASAVEAAASALRASGDLGGTRVKHTWRLAFDHDERNDRRERPNTWLLDLMQWIAEEARWIVWLLGAAALAVVLVVARRWWRLRGDGAGARVRMLPQRVRDLDIRPESLPADVGAAARALWLAGERRAALSLLYRGTLSRLVHAYAVPIEDASTEDDCVRLARGSLTAAAAAFVARLVRAWQLAVYGDRPLDTDAVLALCDDFDRELPAGAAP